jgi:hypothetical protein
VRRNAPIGVGIQLPVPVRGKRRDGAGEEPAELGGGARHLWT